MTHELRSMTPSGRGGTVLADDPLLTARLPDAKIHGQ
jgi:riboflavin biosynthesis pyrimidine reductase